MTFEPRLDIEKRLRLKMVHDKRARAIGRGGCPMGGDDTGLDHIAEVYIGNWEQTLIHWLSVDYQGVHSRPVSPEVKILFLCVDWKVCYCVLFRTIKLPSWVFVPIYFAILLHCWTYLDNLTSLLFLSLSFIFWLLHSIRSRIFEFCSRLCDNIRRAGS